MARDVRCSRRRTAGAAGLRHGHLPGSEREAGVHGERLGDIHLQSGRHGRHAAPLFNAINPDWSPNGKTLAFESGGKFPGGPDPVLTPAEIYIAGADGSNPRNLTNSDAFESSPAWSPSGKEIAFARSNGNGSDIWRLNVDSGDRGEGHQLLRHGRRARLVAGRVEDRLRAGLRHLGGGPERNRCGQPDELPGRAPGATHRAGRPTARGSPSPSTRRRRQTSSTST